MSHLNKKISAIFTMLVLVFACQSPEPKDKSAASKDGTGQLVVEQDNTEVAPEKVYTYQFLEDPADPMADVPSVEKPAVSPADVVERTLGEQSKDRKGLDRSPLFSRDCLTRDSAERCSHQYLSAYVEDYVEKKKIDATTPSPLMYVSFILEKDGSIQEGSIRVDEKNSICEDCVQLAREMVKDMPNWVPGMKDGKLRRSTIKFPVHFKESK